MAGWAREVAATIADYAKGYEDKLMGKRILLAAIKKKGNILRNCGGSARSSDPGDFVWDVAYRQAALTVDDAETPAVPVRQDRWKVAGLPYVGYMLTDSMTKREKLRNKGPEAIINIFDEMGKRLMDDAGQQFCKELYVDSSATGNSGRISGLETMFAISGTVDLTSTAANSPSRSANNGDVVGAPSDTYAGLSTLRGNYGGSWTAASASGSLSTHWPAGTGDMQFDFYSPIVAHSESTASELGGSGDTWATQGVQLVRYVIIHNSRYTQERNGTKIFLMERDFYRQYLNQLDTKERINVENKEMRELGFKDTISQDGVDITWEIDMPGATAYLYDIDNMQLRTCQEDLFKIEGPWYEKLQRAYPCIVDFYGQLKFHSPRFFAKIADIV